MALGSAKGELVMASSDFAQKDSLDVKFRKHIRHIQLGVDTSKLIVACDDFKVYVVDLEKRVLAANGLLEGHLDVISGLDVFKNQLGLATW